jgi:hypothetical protein
MDHVTATANYALLKALPPRTKICVTRDTGKMSLDARWFTSTRRYLTGDSRKDLEQPMQQTFMLMQDSTPKAELLQTIAHAHTTLKELYESAPEIDELFQRIVTGLESMTSDSEPPASPPASPASPAPVRSNNIAIGTSAVVRRTPRVKQENSNQKPEDIRIVIDFDLPSEDEPPVGECGLYEIFPCLRSFVKWLKEKLSD